MSALSPICAEDSWSPGSIECARNYQSNTEYNFHSNDNILVSFTLFLKLLIVLFLRSLEIWHVLLDFPLSTKQFYDLIPDLHISVGLVFSIMFQYCRLSVMSDVISYFFISCRELSIHLHLGRPFSSHCKHFHHFPRHFIIRFMCQS